MRGFKLFVPADGGTVARMVQLVSCVYDFTASPPLVCCRKCVREVGYGEAHRVVLEFSGEVSL